MELSIVLVSTRLDSTRGEGLTAAVIMGIYDRDYFQEDSGGGGFFSGSGSAVKTLLLINVAVFVLQWIGSNRVQEAFILYGAAWSESIFERFWIWQLLTYAFLHGSLFHILFNMLILWFAGRELENIYGRREFLGMYLTAAIVSGFCWAAIDYLEPGGMRGPMLGASGAVAAVLVVYAMYYPRREVLLFFIIPVQIWVLVILFLALDLFNLLQQLQGESTAAVAFAAHLGGAAYGFAYKRYDLRWSRLTGDWSMRWKRRRFRVVSPEDRTRAPRRGASTARSDGGDDLVSPAGGYFADENLEARLDEILAKIARHGRDALTEEEHRILQEASQRARNRRGERLR